MDPLHILSTDQCLTVEKILHHNTLPISIMEHLQTRVFNIRVLVQNQIQPKDRILLLFNFLLLSSFQGTIKKYRICTSVHSNNETLVKTTEKYV